MSTEPLLEALRRSTRAQHDEIEALLGLMQPLALARYTAILTGFHAFLSRWEPRIDAALPAHLRTWWQPHRRSALAVADLHHLGALGNAEPAETEQASHAAAEHAVRALPLHSLPQTLGSMYVIEGSALGGQVITPRLQQQLGMQPGAGASYFHGHGPATGTMWREFRQVLTAEVAAAPPAVEAACQAARTTFQALATVFRALPA